MTMINLPPIYAITDARRDEPLAAQVERLGRAGFPLVQFRGKPLDAKRQWLELRSALVTAASQGGWPAICLNDRADLAVLAASEGLALWGLHLGQSDLPPGEALRLPGLERLHLGTSTRSPGEWGAPDPACDHAGVGPVRATGTKPDHAEPLGLEGLRHPAGGGNRPGGHRRPDLGGRRTLFRGRGGVAGHGGRTGPCRASRGSAVAGPA